MKKRAYQVKVILLAALIICACSGMTVSAADDLGEYSSEQDGIAEPVAEDTSGQISDETPEQILEELPEQESEQTPEQTLEELPEQGSEQTPEQTPEETLEQTSGQIPEQTSEQMPEDTFGRKTTEEISEQMMSEEADVTAANALYAQSGRYAIIFKGKGNTSGTMEKMANLEYGQKYKLPLNAFVKKGCIFLGWTTAKDGSGTEYADGAEFEKTSAEGGATVTLYAKWLEEQYEVEYQLDDGENDASNPETYTVSSNIKLKKPSKYGYTFKGWYNADDFRKKVTGITKGSTGDKTFYAKWALTRYKITYKLNGGKNSGGNPAKYDIETPTIVLETPTKKGFDFEGWYTDAGFENGIEKIDTGSAGKITLYAKWSPIRYTISFDAGGAGGILPEPIECDYGKKYKVPWPDLAMNGYVFRGWCMNAAGSGNNHAPNGTVKNLTSRNGANVTLYATWTKLSSTEESYAEKVVEIVNQNRKKHGLSPLTANPTLTAVAQERAYETVRSFSHTRPNGNICFELFKAAGYAYYTAGENIAYGYRNPTEVMSGWMNSTGHRANILNESFTEIGVGCYNYNGRLYWVQCFGAPYK